MERRHFLATGFLAGLDTPSPSLTQRLLPVLTPTDRGPLKPFYTPPEPIQVGPNSLGFRIPVRSSQTNRQFSCMEGIMGPKLMGPAPHVHKDLDELMFVQEGTVSILVDDKVYEVEAGGWHLRHHGLVHTFWNATDKPVRYIDMFFSQDFENFLEAMFAKLIPDLMKRGVSLTAKEATDKMDALYTQYGITMFEEQRPPIMAKYGLKG